MKKGVCAIFILAVLTLVFLGADRLAVAVEVGTVNANATDTNVAVANSDDDKTTARLVDVGAEKKSAGLGKGSKEKTENYNAKESLDKTKDNKSLEEPKSKDSVGNEQLDNIANSTTVAMEDSHVEGCDPSNSCIDEKHKLIACLRVPGQDSLDLSLLIQNKGTTALDVKIVAPYFVHMENTSIKLEPKISKEVRVLVKDDASDTTITLQAKDGNCSLNLRNAIPTSIRNETSRLARFLNLAAHNFSISMLLFAAVLGGGAWLCIRFWRRRASGYQKIDVVLPVSTGGSKETDEADGWDNSWGDGWDDEAPTTPSKPVSTPFKGLASRRLNKDGWKD